MLFLADALIDRLGGQRPVFARQRQSGMPRSRTPKRPRGRDVPPPTSENAAKPPPPSSAPRRTIFDQAKNIRPR